MREKVVLPDAKSIKIVNRLKPESPVGYAPFKADPDGGVPTMAPFGTGYRYHVTGLTHDEGGFPSNRGDVNDSLIRRLNRKIEKAESAIRDYVTDFTDDCETLVVAFGSSAMSSLSAVRQAREKGVKAGLFRPKTLWPFPESVLSGIVSKTKRVIVAEMNLGQIANEIERIAAGKAKVERLGKVNGELFKPEEILSVIMGGAK
jgi:2-oxoglutarate ferredoxin oxidoreductase subunit alpha